MTASALGFTHDFERVRSALRNEIDVLDAYLQGLTAFQWDGPTASADWNVRKVVSHLGSGADLHLRSLRTSLERVPAVTAEERQGVWGYFDSLTPDLLLPEFENRSRAYLDAIDKLSVEEGQDRLMQSFLGETPVVNFVQTRLGETALHSWDIRVGLDATARLLADTVRAHFPQVLDTLTRRSKAEARAALDGTRYGLEVFGPLETRFTLDVTHEALQVSEGLNEPHVTLRLSAEAFVRLHAGRLPLERAESAGEVLVDGDRDRALRLNELFAGF
jgi:uncharacterized protein (TIGR03083 family)